MTKNRQSIYSALIANLLIAITKFIAGAFTNSSSMISEGIHSVVDTINEVLLLYGLKRSRKPPDKARPFGYGKELYFWSFIVSILIFALGGGLSIYQGILHIIHPEELGDPTWNYVVLLLSLVFEGASLWVAIKAFNSARKNQSFWNAVVSSKDPTSFLILFEDGAAVIGLIIVFIMMQLSHALQMPVLDGLASVFVGVLLIAVSLILARESRSLLMGEGIAQETQRKIIDIAEKDETVEKVSNLLSTYQSPEEVILVLIITFKQDLDTEEITSGIDRIQKAIQHQYQLIQFIIIQPGTVDR